MLHQMHHPPFLPDAMCLLIIPAGSPERSHCAWHCRCRHQQRTPGRHSAQPGQLLLQGAHTAVPGPGRPGPHTHGQGPHRAQPIPHGQAAAVRYPRECCQLPLLLLHVVCLLGCLAACPLALVVTCAVCLSVVEPCIPSLPSIVVRCCTMLRLSVLGASCFMCACAYCCYACTDFNCADIQYARTDLTALAGGTQLPWRFGELLYKRQALEYGQTLIPQHCASCCCCCCQALRWLACWQCSRPAKT